MISRVSAGRRRAIRRKAQRAAPPMVSSSSGTNRARAGRCGGVADLAQQGERAHYQPVVGFVQQIFAVGVEHADQQGSAIGAARQDAIDQRRVDGIQAGHEEFVEQAVRFQFAGDGFGFAVGRGRAARPGRRDPSSAWASGSKWSFSLPSAA